MRTLRPDWVAPEKTVGEEVEEKSIDLAEAKAGVRLKAGHRVHLIVSGAHGSRRYGRSSGWDEQGSEDAATAGTAAAGAGGSSAETRLAPGTPGGIKDGKFAIEIQLHAAGGTPLVNERVRIHDPDTGQPVGDPGVTDEDGVLRARVPDEKEYQIHLDAGAPEEHPDAFGDADHPLAAHLPDPDGHPVLHVAFVDPAGAPVKGEAVQVKDKDGASQDLKTDEGGAIQVVVEHGVFTLELRGTSYLAHSVLSGDLQGEGAPYLFRVAS